MLPRRPSGTSAVGAAAGWDVVRRLGQGTLAAKITVLTCVTKQYHKMNHWRNLFTQLTLLGSARQLGATLTGAARLTIVAGHFEAYSRSLALVSGETARDNRAGVFLPSKRILFYRFPYCFVRKKISRRWIIFSNCVAMIADQFF